MGRAKCVAVVGVTGAVGLEMLETLEKRNFPVSSIKLLASARSAGKKMKFKGEEITVEELTENSFKGVDYALFSAGGSISEAFAKACVDSGAVMIDNSSAFRMVDTVPLVIPEINAEDAFKHQGIIANPNCTTAIMAVAVYPLHVAKKVKRLICSTYQAASGGGAPAMQELMIMHAPEMQISCTSVRVPVLRAHSESINLEFENEITPEEARAILAKAPGVQVFDNPAEKQYPMPINVTGKYDVQVGRIRQDISRSDKRGLDLFVSGDQLLKGAALNAVQIAEVLNR